MKVSDGCQSGVNQGISHRFSMAAQSRQNSAGGVHKQSRIQYDPIIIISTICDECKE